MGLGGDLGGGELPAAPGAPTGPRSPTPPDRRRGSRSSEAGSAAALEEAVLRLSQLADELPEVAELDLNPVIARPDGVVAVDARVRVRPARPLDPYLRRLR